MLRSRRTPVWAAGCDGIIRAAWDVQTGAVARKLEGHDGIVTSVSVDPTNQVVVTGGWDARVIVWDGLASKPRFRLVGHTTAVQDVALSPDWRRMASGGWDGTVRLWDVQSGQAGRVLEGHEDQVRAVLWLDRKRLASGSHDRTVRVWDTESGRELSVGSLSHTRRVPEHRRWRAAAAGGRDGCGRGMGVSGPRDEWLRE